MAIEVKLKKVGNSFEKLLQPILNLERENVEVGHFQEQGQHYSGFTYPELMALHHYGHEAKNGAGEKPPRPLLDHVFFSNYRLNDPAFRSAFNAWSRRMPSEASNSKLLDDIGKIIATKEKNMFGKSPPLAPMAGNIMKEEQQEGNDPLIDTGSLRDAVSFKTSKNKTLRGV
jgi:hypothetical protein